MPSQSNPSHHEPTPSDSTPRTPSSWLEHAYRQITASWRNGFLGSGPSIVPPDLPELSGQPVLGSLSAFRRDLIGLLQTASALGPLARFPHAPHPDPCRDGPIDCP